MADVLASVIPIPGLTVPARHNIRPPEDKLKTQLAMIFAKMVSASVQNPQVTARMSPRCRAARGDKFWIRRGSSRGDKFSPKRGFAAPPKRGSGTLLNADEKAKTTGAPAAVLGCRAGRGDKLKTRFPMFFSPRLPQHLFRIPRSWRICRRVPGPAGG